MRPSVMNLCFCSSPRVAYNGLAASTILSRFARLCARRSAFAVKRSIGDKLLPCSFCRARRRALCPSLTADFKWPPKPLLVGVQPKTCLHALELGFNRRVRPTLLEFGVRGRLIALRRGGDDETGSGDGGCGRRGGKRSDASAFHDDASWAVRFFRDFPDESLREAESGRAGGHLQLWNHSRTTRRL